MGYIYLEKIEKSLVFVYISNRWSPCGEGRRQHGCRDAHREGLGGRRTIPKLEVIYDSLI